LKHECIVYVARLTESQCMSCSHMTDGTHTSFIMTAGGLDRALAGPVSSRQSDAHVTGHSMRTKHCDGRWKCFIASSWGVVS
jgi:hypothetical protein